MRKTLRHVLLTDVTSFQPEAWEIPGCRFLSSNWLEPASTLSSKFKVKSQSFPSSPLNVHYILLQIFRVSKTVLLSHSGDQKNLLGKHLSHEG